MEQQIAANDKRIGRLEQRIDRMEERQREIETEQAETRVYVKQIFERINDLKFMFTQATTQPPEDTGAQERQQTQWIEFAKWIIGGTIFVIIAYIFKTQGVK